MHSIESSAHPAYVLPVVRELPRPDRTRELPPDRPSGLTQPELVRASLLGARLR